MKNSQSESLALMGKQGKDLSQCPQTPARVIVLGGGTEVLLLQWQQHAD